ncbi:putative bifunctional diguanylate cyclase/phosphodiesterase [Deinococcus deserti]|uniref:putative bifunctional diguanylate cyclase/phosphodiesterase n=1 Tax=Deinococcus deserti TaxID=310783 RepID=UPI001392218F|nr:EAL domain-containing protein [Deinococcus deserti]
MLLSALVGAAVLHSLALLLAHYGVTWPEGTLDLAYLSVVGLGLALSVRAWRTSGPGARPALWALSMALTLYAAGDLLWTWLSLFTQQPLFPSVADIFYLAQYLPLVLALLRLSHLSLRRLSAARLVLDSAIVTVVVGLFAWQAGLATVADDPAQSLPGRIISLAYPLASLAVLGVLVLVASGARRVQVHVAVFATGLSLIVVGDLGYALLEANGAYSSAHPIDALWAWALVLLALGGQLAAHHYNRYPREAGKQHPGPRRLIVWLPYGAVLSLAVFLPQLYLGASVMERGIAFGVFTVLILVTLRQGVALADNRRLNAELRRAHVQLAHDARHDALTGLLNRSGLVEYLRQALSPETPAPFAVLFVDLDRMKRVNDAHGHQTGDQMLREMSRRLLTVAPAGSVVARVGGDEFVLVVPEQQRASVALLAAQVVAVISEPAALQSGTTHLTASVGVALFPGDGQHPDELVRAADMAMDGAKVEGRNNWSFYDEGALQAAQHDTQLEALLRRALAEDELELHYQPLVDLRSGATLGFEALLRWRDTVQSPVSPPEIIRVAEERGLIVPLGIWGLRQAVAQASQWRARGKQWFVTVNISALHFAHGDFLSHVRAALDEHDLPGEALILELTESALLEDLDSSMPDLNILTSWGVRIALDDFGTGYSSLSYLRSLPVHLVKIDKAFVFSLQQDGHAFVKAITVLAHGLNLLVVAEGIEEAWQLEGIGALGVDLGQGFLLGQPLPASLAGEVLGTSGFLRGNEPTSGIQG